MSFGKMNTFIDIITTEPVKDDEGFVNTGDTVLASVRAYKEERHGSPRSPSVAPHKREMEAETATYSRNILFIVYFPIKRFGLSAWLQTNI